MTLGHFWLDVSKQGSDQHTALVYPLYTACLSALELEPRFMSQQAQVETERPSSREQALLPGVDGRGLQPSLRFLCVKEAKMGMYLNKAWRPGPADA